jgi:hypothetical protein
VSSLLASPGQRQSVPRNPDRNRTLDIALIDRRASSPLLVVQKATVSAFPRSSFRLSRSW